VSDISAAARPQAAGINPSAVQTRPVAAPCPRCGGSGQLRTGHGSYRSCLECAARGILNQPG